MTANDSDVSDGDTLTGSQVVRVYGQNLTAPFVTLTFGDVEYTPLAQGEGYVEFILGDNGTATINVDGSPFMSFEVEGIVVPEELPTTFIMWQFLADSDRHNRLAVSQVKCINYPFIYDENFPNFRAQIGNQSFPFYNLATNDFSSVNCTFGLYNNPAGFNTSVTLYVIDKSKPAWLTYKGFIIVVFNYTTD